MSSMSNNNKWRQVGRLKSAIFYRYISETVHASFSEILNCVSLLWLRCHQPLFRQHHLLTGTHMRSIEWWCFQWPYVTLTTSKHPTGAFPLKRAPSSAGIWTPSNARFIGLTPVRSSNAMSIVQPFFAQLISVPKTHTQTDRQTDIQTDDSCLLQRGSDIAKGLTVTLNLPYPNLNRRYSRPSV